MEKYRKFMKVVTKVEEVILSVAMLLVLVLTFGNVIARKIFMHSWGFTEEITVAVFVLISLLGAGCAAQEDGGLVNLNLIPERVSPKAAKVLRTISWICCMVYAAVLTYEGVGRMIADNTLTPILHIHKYWFWLFIVVGGISLMLHLTCNFINAMTGYTEVPEFIEADDDEEEAEALVEEVEEGEEKIAEEKAEAAAEKTAAVEDVAENSEKGGDRK
jgi:TRAP-type C4-dicarboxylate transport system permease small subunit